jgi:ferredoxin
MTKQLANIDMVKVIAQGKTIECSSSANLRQVLLKHSIDLYNSGAKVINCHGIGSCGTCAVLVEGEVSEPNWRDKTRRSLPPHSPTRNLRLACQTKVLGDVKVTKFDGFWGEGTEVVWKS